MKYVPRIRRVEVNKKIIKCSLNGSSSNETIACDDVLNILI